MAKSAQQQGRTPEQLFEVILERARAYYSATPDSQRREELRRILDELTREYCELTGERIVY